MDGLYSVKKRYVILSTFLHLLLCLVVFIPMQSGKHKGEEGSGDENSVSGDIVPKLIEVDILSYEDIQDGETLEEKKKPLQEQKPKDGLTECTDDMWFGGVGIHMYYDTIEQVVPGYPAQKGGLQEGDRILTSKNDQGMYEDIRGEPGTYINIHIYRQKTDEYLTIRLIRDRICTRERKKND